MRAAQAWKILGLKPSSDRRAVKRAYAEKLKAIDPDKEVKAFLELRDALAAAQADADWRAHREAAGEAEEAATDEPEYTDFDDLDDEDFQSFTINARIDSGPAFTADSDPPDTFPLDPEEHVEPAEVPPELADRYRLEELLYGEPGENDRAELEAVFERILADPALEQLDNASRAEDWLAGLFAHTVPRSDPLIPRAVTFFRWDQELGSAHGRYQVVWLAQRAEDLRCIAALEEPGHHWHRAFTLLREEPAASIALKDKLQLMPQVAQLLASLRWHNPGVERELNADHVAMWDKAIGKGEAAKEAAREPKGEVSWFAWLGIAWFALSVLRFAFPSSPAAPPVADRAPMIQLDDSMTAPGSPPKLSGETMQQLRECIVSGGRPRMNAGQLECGPGGGAAAPAPQARLVPQAPDQPEKLPPNIQQCVDAGGKLRITPTQYICERSVPVQRPAQLPDPGSNSPADRTSGSDAIRPVAPSSTFRQGQSGKDPSAIADDLVKKMADCIDRQGKPGSGQADCEQFRK